MRRLVYGERIEICLSKTMKKELERAAMMNDSNPDSGAITTNELIRRILSNWLNGTCY